jgi:hypothetical protein
VWVPSELSVNEYNSVKSQRLEARAWPAAPPPTMGASKVDRNVEMGVRLLEATALVG